MRPWPARSWPARRQHRARWQSPATRTRPPAAHPRESRSAPACPASGPASWTSAYGTAAEATTTCGHPTSIPVSASGQARPAFTRKTECSSSNCPKPPKQSCRTAPTHGRSSPQSALTAADEDVTAATVSSGQLNHPWPRPWQYRIGSGCDNVRHMPTAAINGIQVSYTDSGGDGPAVVLSHGYLMDASMFDAQVAALAPEYRVITWDQRGHGGTPAPGPFSYWDSASDVLALLDHLGIEQAVLGGMSQGGFLSLRAALLAPQRVLGLVLIDSQGGTEEEANRPGYEQLHQAWLDHGPGAVQEIVAAIILGP